ncbi:MAG: MBL fold metallo-hydrolase [Clostridia bacterium]|nr:MBL fold metallo-hydrolase [Clostridia bacterium]
MRVEYFGHACFLLADNNFSVIIDPFSGIGYELANPTADFCLCSHSHFDHNATHKVCVNKVISPNDYNTFSWLNVISSFHDEVKGCKRGENNIFVIEVGGFKVCHMGDLGEPFNSEICEKIGKIDILLIPVGGTYTINAKEAIEYVKKINPSLVIPMHYKTQKSQIDIAEKWEFLRSYSNVIKSKASFEIAKIPEELTVFDIDDNNF